MKLNSHRLFLLALASASILGLSALRADDDGEQGGDIEGSESMDVQIMLTPTADAPPGSSITASVEADDEGGAVEGKLKLKTEGLPAGVYSVSVTLKSDGSTVSLGTFTVAATPTPTPTPSPTASPTATPGDDDGDDDGDDQGDDNDNQGDDDHGDCEFGNGTSLPFPANFNPFDIATISVSDSNGVVLFTADLTNVSAAQSMNFTANVQAKGGLGNPGATGTAMLSAAATRRGGTGSLQLSGQGLPAKMPLTFAINGSPVKSVKSNKNGNVNVVLKAKGKNSAVAPGINLFKITSVGLHDKNGNLVLGASF